MARKTPAGYQKVLDLFGPDPLASGDVWFFDPTSQGDATGESPEKALRTAADFNEAKFETGDNWSSRPAPAVTHRENPQYPHGRYRGQAVFHRRLLHGQRQAGAWAWRQGPAGLRRHEKGQF